MLQSFTHTMAFPPSPVLSECDTLADMVDLDAYLAAQGPLSNFPTPPLKAGVAVSVHVEEFDVEKELYEDPRNDRNTSAPRTCRPWLTAYRLLACHPLCTRSGQHFTS